MNGSENHSAKEHVTKQCRQGELVYHPFDVHGHLCEMFT